MPLSLAPIIPVLLGVVFAQAALGLMTPLIPLLLLRAGVSTLAIGVVASAYSAGFMAGALSAHRIVLRVGHIRAFAVFAAVAADAALVLGFLLTQGVAISPAWQTIAARLLIGYAASGMFLVAESWLNDHAEAETRGRVFGAYLVASWGASALGPLLLNVVPASPMLFIVIGMSFTTAVLPLALTVRPNPRVAAQARLSFRRLFQISPVGAACALTSGLVNSAYYGLAPVYLERLGYGAGQVAAFVSAAMIAGLAVQAPVGVLSDRYGRRPLALVTLALAFSAALLMGIAGHLPFALLAATGFVFAGSTGPLYGLGAGLTNDRMDRGDYVAASGALLFTWAVASAIGPSVAGAITGAAGTWGFIAYLIAVLGLTGLFIAVRMTRRTEVPREKRSTFVPAPTTPTGNAELVARITHRLRHPLHVGPSLRAILRRTTVPHQNP